MFKKCVCSSDRDKLKLEYISPISTQLLASIFNFKGRLAWYVSIGSQRPE